MTRPRRAALARLGTCAALALTLVAAPAATAQARAGGPYAVGRTVFRLAGLAGSLSPRTAAVDARAGSRHVPNPDFAGYLARRSGPAEVVARFTVPDLACTRRETAIGPGAFLLTGPDDRLLFNSANIIVGCYKGVASAQEALEVNGVEKDYTRNVQPGDRMLARLADEPGKQTVVQLRDLTPGHRFVLTGTGRGAAPKAELAGDWGSIDSQTGISVAPPDFEPTTFRSVSIDGRALGSTAPIGFDMANSKNVLQISTSPVLGPGHDMFSCERKFPRS